MFLFLLKVIYTQQIDPIKVPDNFKRLLRVDHFFVRVTWRINRPFITKNRTAARFVFLLPGSVRLFWCLAGVDYQRL